MLNALTLAQPLALLWFSLFRDCNSRAQTHPKPDAIKDQGQEL